MKRRRFFEALALTVFGLVALNIAVPMLIEERELPNNKSMLKLNLIQTYKECATKSAKEGRIVFVRDLIKFQDLKNTKDWKVSGLYDRQIALDSDCTKLTALGTSLNHQYPVLKFGLDFGKANKFCYTGIGEVKQDWSCE